MDDIEYYNLKLRIAIVSRDATGVEIAIERGGDANGIGRKHPLLIEALRDRNFEGAAALIKAGANIKIAAKNTHNTPIMIAANAYAQHPHQKIAVLELLLKAGANANDLALRQQVEFAHIIDRIKKFDKNENSLFYKEKNKLSCTFATHRALKSNSSTSTNKNIVVVFKTRIPECGNLCTIYDFHAKTVTDVVGNRFGVANSFSRFRQNRSSIMEAYTWLKHHGHDVPHPFTNPIRCISRR